MVLSKEIEATFLQRMSEEDRKEYEDALKQILHEDLTIKADMIMNDDYTKTYDQILQEVKNKKPLDIV